MRALLGTFMHLRIITFGLKIQQACFYPCSSLLCRSAAIMIQVVHPYAAGRYHLYISYACPWADGTLAIMNLKVCVNVLSMRPLELDVRGYNSTGTRFEIQV